jgi:DNA-binding SARP family transcriptional activator
VNHKEHPTLPAPGNTWVINTGDAAWVVDNNQRIIFWNEAMEQLTGYSAAEALGQPCYQLLGGRSPEGAVYCHHQCAVITRARQGILEPSFDLLVQAQESEPLPVNVSIVSHYDQSGPGGLTAVAHLARPARHKPGRPSALRIYLLGTTIVRRSDGFLVEGPLWQRVKVRALLAILAQNQGQPVHREVILEQLWPDLDYPSALHNLNTTIYDLRHSLEPELKHGAQSQYVHYGSDHYLLQPAAGYWLDTDAFEKGIGRAYREQEASQAITIYHSVLRLYRGDFLADLGLGFAWYWSEQNRLRELYLTALEQLAALYEQQHSEEPAYGTYLKAWTIDPCRESACRPLLRILLRRGDRATAITYYQQLVKVLRQELGVDPGLETQRLYQEARDAA